METSFIDKLKKIKLSISEIMSGTDVQLDTADTLEDGTPVQFSPDLEAGATVMITSEEGTQPLTDGEYTLMSANKTVIIYEGKVQSIQEKKELDAVAELQKVFEQKLSEETKGFVTLAKVTELETKLSEQSELIAKQTGVINELFEAISNFTAQAPTREVSQKSATGGKFNPEAIAAALEEIKKSKNSIIK